MKELKEALRALLKGTEGVITRRKVTDRRTFLSELFLKNHPVIIFYEEGEEIKKLKPHALGYYLSPHLIEKVAGSEIVLIVFVDELDTKTLAVKTKGVLLIEGEAVEFRVDPKVWEIEAIFTLLENHKEEEEIEL